jgi:hypothetical protein
LTHSISIQAVRRDGRTGVEAEPANPQQRSANQAQHEIVRRHRLLPVAAPLAEDQCRHQPGDSGVDVNHRAAGEIENPGIGEKPARRPDPMRNRRIDQHRPQPDEPQQRRELHAPTISAGVMIANVI